MGSRISSCVKAWPCRFFLAELVICGFVLGEDSADNVTTRVALRRRPTVIRKGSQPFLDSLRHLKAFEEQSPPPVCFSAVLPHSVVGPPCFAGPSRELMRRGSPRELALDMAAVCLSGSLRQSAEAQTARTKTLLVLLGPAGGPRPGKMRVLSSQVVVVNGAAYVIECGMGVTTQLVLADIRLSSLRHVFITITIPTTTPNTVRCC